jgi:hypothetical protein
MKKATNSYSILSIFFLIFILFSCNKSDVKNEDLKKEKNKSEEQTENIISPQRSVDSEVKSEKTEKYEPVYDFYVNSRFGFSFKYPSDRKKQNESANGDGCEFIYGDGFNIKVYGSNDPGVLNQSLEDFYLKEIKNHKDITYKTKKNNWFVISGYDGDMIFYIKMYVGSESRNVLYLNYPSNLRDKYYDAITVISKFFKEGNINESH